MTGYVRQDTSNNIADGNVINAADLDSEFDGLQAAFNASTGHVHDGTTGNGAPILVVGPTQDVVVSATAVTPKTTNTVDIGSSSLKFKDIFITGTATLPTVSATTVGATTGNITTVNATTVDTTNIEVTTLKAKDGTAAGSIADSTGVVTLASSILTTADINGGTLDNVVIGGTTAAAASVTTLTTSSTVTHNGGTANGVAYLNGSKVLTTGSALTFDGTDFVLASGGLLDIDSTNAAVAMRIRQTTAGAGTEFNTTITENTGVTFDCTDGGATARSFIWTQAGSEQMRLTSTGLGIGTSSPGQKLHVQGSGDVARFTNGSSSAYVANDSQGFSLLSGAGQTGTGFYVNNTNAYISFWSSASEKMRLDSSGNLGLGVTPSAWALFTGNLELNNGNTFSGNAAQNSLTQNAYYGSGGWTYKTTAAASRYQQISGAHAWHTAASGTAGNAISFTQAMTLTANGNLLVGGTNENTSRLVDLVSSSKTQLALTYPGSATWGVSTNSDASLSFNNGTERARIDSSGNFTIGGQTATRLEVNLTENDKVELNAVDSTNTARNLVFSTGDTERARIDSSGNLLVGTTSASNNGSSCRMQIAYAGGSTQYGFGFKPASDSTRALDFSNAAGSNVGSITTSATATAYNTSSDYRLKNITGPITNSGAYIDSLNPVEGTWKVDGSTFVGLIAHEVQEASRTTVVTGKKDGEEMQAMDYSNPEIIANMIAELKSLRARVAQLESN